MLLNFEDILESTMNKDEKTEQILGIIMTQKHSSKVDLKHLGEKG